jgi:DNA invertase Pin-like site-specific DNA recombinase
LIPAARRIVGEPKPARSLQVWGVSLLAISGLQFNLSTPHGKMIGSVTAALAEYKRALICKRIKPGIAATKVRGEERSWQSGQRPSDRKAYKVLTLAEPESATAHDRSTSRTKQEHSWRHRATRTLVTAVRK